MANVILFTPVAAYSWASFTPSLTPVVSAYVSPIHGSGGVPAQLLAGLDLVTHTVFWLSFLNFAVAFFNPPPIVILDGGIVVDAAFEWVEARPGVDPDLSLAAMGSWYVTAVVVAAVALQYLVPNLG